MLMCDQTAWMAVMMRPIEESDGKLNMSKGNACGQGSSNFSFANVVIIVWLIIVEWGVGKCDKMSPTALNHY